MMDRQFTELRHDMLGHFDEVYRRFERLEQEYRRRPSPKWPGSGSSGLGGFDDVWSRGYRVAFVARGSV